MRYTKTIESLEGFGNNEGTEEETRQDFLTFVAHVISSLRSVTQEQTPVGKVCIPPFNVTRPLNELLHLLLGIDRIRWWVHDEVVGLDVVRAYNKEKTRQPRCGADTLFRGDGTCRNQIYRTRARPRSFKFTLLLCVLTNGLLALSLRLLDIVLAIG